jgi:hypothetical protein
MVLTVNSVATIPAKASTLMPEFVIWPPSRIRYTIRAAEIDKIPCAVLKHTIQNFLRWTNTSADICITAAVSNAAAGGKCNTQASNATKEIEEDAFLSPTEKSIAKASDKIPSAMKARRPPNSTKDIAVTKVQWPAIAMPMDPKTTKITYTYDRRFIADAMAPARCLSTNRNPTSGKTHQCPDGVNNVGKH